MQQFSEFTDERNKTWCIHCTRTLADVETSRDHVPSKVLLNRPFPANLPVVEICQSCNSHFSIDEEYLVAFMGAVISGTTDPDHQTLTRAGAILERNAGLRKRIERSKSEYRTRGGETKTLWTPEIDRIKRVLVKNARGHAFFETGEPIMDKPTSVIVMPLDSMSSSQRDDFEEIARIGWPEIGSRMMTRLVTGIDLAEEGWIEVQDGAYRYAVVQDGLMLVRTVLFGYLAAEVWWSTAE